MPKHTILLPDGKVIDATPYVARHKRDAIRECLTTAINAPNIKTARRRIMELYNNLANL